jgi:hypothetical protein
VPRGQRGHNAPQETAQRSSSTCPTLFGGGVLSGGSIDPILLRNTGYGIRIQYETRPGQRTNMERRMADENMSGITHVASPKEWRPPKLRRLPIAATAGSGKVITRANDGVGGGKGDVSTSQS